MEELQKLNSCKITTNDLTLLTRLFVKEVTGTIHIICNASSLHFIEFFYITSTQI